MFDYETIKATVSYVDLTDKDMELLWLTKISDGTPIYGKRYSPEHEKRTGR